MAQSFDQYNKQAQRAQAAKQQAVPRKVRRSAQTVSAEQSAAVPSQPVWVESPPTVLSQPQPQVESLPTTSRPTVAHKHPQKTERKRQKNEQKAQAQALAAQKAAKKEHAQRIARQVAQKHAAQQVANNAHPKKEQQVKRQAVQGKPAVAPVHKSKKQKKRTPRENPNYAPMYNQYDGAQTQDVSHQGNPVVKQKGITKQVARRKRRFQAVVASLLVLVLVSVGIIYSLNLLFKVQSIQIQSPTGEVPADTGIYTEEIILAKLNIHLEDNFFSFSTKEQSQLLQQSLPLLEHIEVIRDYPNTILVRLEPAVETYTMQIAGGWLVLSEELNVISTVPDKPNLTVLIGATPSTYVAGQALAFVQSSVDNMASAAPTTGSDETADATTSEQTSDDTAAVAQQQSDASLATITSLLSALEQTALLKDITAIEFQGEKGISFLYQNRIVVLVGTINSLEYKLSLARYLLWNENGDGCAETDTGLLDVSAQSENSKVNTSFAQGQVVFPLGNQVQNSADSEDETTTEIEAELQAEPETEPDAA